MDKLEKALVIYIADLTDSCPMDVHNWEYPEGCEKVCIQDMPRYVCWLEYFKEQVK